MKWEVLSSEYLTQHPPYFVSRKDVCKKPDGTLIPAYYVVEMPASVIVFPLLDDDTVLMVKQYRHPVAQISIELPGGFIDEGETPLDAAKRETLEETGYVFSDYEYLGKTAANPGVLNNFTHMFIAKGVVDKQAQQLDRSEEISFSGYTFAALKDMLKTGEIIQSMHMNACFYALMHLDKLRFH
jgi:8-oxo-dGTP pyrophosphatase MutT (NUDIX family)